MNGLCECGCGKRPNTARQTRTDRGWIKGQPKRFLAGHHIGWMAEIEGKATVAQLFAARVKLPVNRDGCWLWTGALNIDGYGRLRLKSRGRGLEPAHRVAYELFVGPVPKGLVMDHLCREHSCVNPTHLEAVTRGENVRRGDHWARPGRARVRI